MQIRNLDPRASGLRPAGHYEPPARSSLTTGIAGESAADAEMRTPRWSAERRKLVRLSALRSPHVARGTE